MVEEAAEHQPLSLIDIKRQFIPTRESHLITRKKVEYQVETFVSRNADGKIVYAIPGSTIYLNERPEEIKIVKE